MYVVFLIVGQLNNAVRTLNSADNLHLLYK